MCVFCWCLILIVFLFQGRGAQWDNFVYPASVDGNFTLFYAIMWLFVDAFVFLMLTWYIDNVNPGTYGVPKPWYFPFKVGYSFLCMNLTIGNTN